MLAAGPWRRGRDKLVGEELRERLGKMSTRSQAAELPLSGLEDVYGQVLGVVLVATASRHGVYGYGGKPPHRSVGP